MKSVLIPFALATVLSSGIAVAADQPASTNPRVACKADVAKLCAGVQQGGGRTAACLKQHEAQVSAGCKDAMAARQKQAPAAPGAAETSKQAPAAPGTAETKKQAPAAPGAPETK